MLFRVHNCLKLNRNKYILISCLVLDEFIIASVSDIIVIPIERTVYTPEKNPSGFDQLEEKCFDGEIHSIQACDCEMKA